MCATFATLSHKKSMKKIVGFCFFFILIVQTVTVAQSKKWTLEECVKYAIENNITIKQSELDSQLIQIDKSSAILKLFATIC